MLDTKGQYTDEFPTAADAGKWFFVKHDGKDGFTPAIRFMEVRLTDEGRIFLAPESSTGIGEEAYGNPLAMYQKQYTSFFGPVVLPPDYADIRQEYYKKRNAHRSKRAVIKGSQE
jgi:hypothetical protein